MLTSGQEAEAIRLVMEMYRPALVAYCAASSFRHRFPQDETPESIVNQFFADQMGREGFLSSWLRAKSRFRYWLLVSFVNHMRYRLRGERAEERRREKLAERQPRLPRDEVRVRFDAELARGLVRTAMKAAEQACRDEGREMDWQTFVAHSLDGMTYGDIAAAESVTLRVVANRVRFAQRRLQQSMAAALSLDGSSSHQELIDELERLKEAIAQWRN